MSDELNRGWLSLRAQKPSFMGRAYRHDYDHPSDEDLSLGTPMKSCPVAKLRLC